MYSWPFTSPEFLQELFQDHFAPSALALVVALQRARQVVRFLAQALVLFHQFGHLPLQGKALPAFLFIGLAHLPLEFLDLFTEGPQQQLQPVLLVVRELLAFFFQQGAGHLPEFLCHALIQRRRFRLLPFQLFQQPAVPLLLGAQLVVQRTGPVVQLLDLFVFFGQFAFAFKPVGLVFRAQGLNFRGNFAPLQKCHGSRPGDGSRQEAEQQACSVHAAKVAGAGGRAVSTGPVGGAGSLAQLSRITTRVPVGMWSYRAMTSRLRMRMQPCELGVPSEASSAVPWI